MACSARNAPGVPLSDPAAAEVFGVAAKKKRRPSACRRGYDRRWRTLRLAVLMSEPLCRRCKGKGTAREAKIVDHIKPLVDGGARLDMENLQPLCIPCHGAKTAEDLKGRACKAE